MLVGPEIQRAPESSPIDLGQLRIDLMSQFTDLPEDEAYMARANVLSAAVADLIGGRSITHDDVIWMKEVFDLEPGFPHPRGGIPAVNGQILLPVLNSYGAGKTYLAQMMHNIGDHGLGYVRQASNTDEDGDSTLFFAVYPRPVRNPDRPEHDFALYWMRPLGSEAVPHITKLTNQLISEFKLDIPIYGKKLDPRQYKALLRNGSGFVSARVNLPFYDDGRNVIFEEDDTHGEITYHVLTSLAVAKADPDELAQVMDGKRFSSAQLLTANLAVIPTDEHARSRWKKIRNDRKAAYNARRNATSMGHRIEITKPEEETTFEHDGWDVVTRFYSDPQYTSVTDGVHLSDAADYNMVVLNNPDRPGLIKRIAYFDGQPIGVLVAEVDSKTSTANIYALIALRRHFDSEYLGKDSSDIIVSENENSVTTSSGLVIPKRANIEIKRRFAKRASDLMVWELMEYCRETGVSYINIGGCEDAQLNQHRQKFFPIARLKMFWAVKNHNAPARET